MGSSVADFSRGRCAMNAWADHHRRGVAMSGERHRRRARAMRIDTNERAARIDDGIAIDDSVGQIAGGQRRAI